MGKNISDLAREQKKDAFDIVVDLILKLRASRKSNILLTKKVKQLLEVLTK